MELTTRIQDYGYVDLIKQLTFITDKFERLHRHRDFSEQEDIRRWLR